MSAIITLKMNLKQGAIPNAVRATLDFLDMKDENGNMMPPCELKDQGEWSYGPIELNKEQITEDGSAFMFMMKKKMDTQVQIYI